MAQIITPADLANVMPTIIAEILHTAEFETIMARLVRQYKLKPGTGASYKISQRGRINVQHLVVGQDMAQPQKDAISQISFTPAEAGGNVVLLDVDVRQAQDDVMRAYGRELGDAMARIVDTDLITAAQGTANSKVFGPTAGTKFGGAGFELTTILRKCVSLLMRPADVVNATLNVIEQAKPPYNMVLHPYHWFDLSAQLTATTSTFPSSLQQDVLDNYRVGRLFSMNIYQDANIPITAQDDATAIAFAQDGLVLVRETGVQFEPERDASHRGTELNVVQSYATGRYSDAWVLKGVAEALIA